MKTIGSFKLFSKALDKALARIPSEENTTFNDFALSQARMFALRFGDKHSLSTPQVEELATDIYNLIILTRV